MAPSISNVRISVAMATYNGDKYIQEQLDSIARQDLLPTELVITDDGSTDATLEIVDAFTQSAPFAVRVFRNEARLGYADNFLKAASLCHGDLIAFCDQDDIWLEKKLNLCSQFFEDPAVVLAVHSARLLLQSGALGSRHPSFSITRVREANTCDPLASRLGFAMVIRRELLATIDRRLRPVALTGHDRWAWFMAASTGKIAVVADVLALYRQHESNVFGVPAPRSIAGRVRQITGGIRYAEAAEIESSCAAILFSASEQHNSKPLRDAATGFELRSGFHRLRATIYNSESSFVDRASAFLKIVLRAGYCPDQSKTRLGPRAAMKDLIFGVPRLYLFFSPLIPPSKGT